MASATTSISEGAFARQNQSNQISLKKPSMHKLHPCLSFLCFLVLCILLGDSLMEEEIVPIGVVLDFNSPIGSMANSSMSIALQDFYKQNPQYKTRLDLQIRDSENDVVKSAFAALHLIEKRKVQAIIGPQSSEQARFIIELGQNYSVPILSFSATSPSLSPIRSQIFIRTAQDDCSQVKAIAEIVKTYGWREIILIYEDTEYGNGLIPYLHDALKNIDTRVRNRSVIDPRSNDIENHVSEEINKLKRSPTKIFLAHMTTDLGSVFFPAAQEAGMMKAGYGWIVTQGLSGHLNPMVPKVMDSMQGVIGVRPRVPHTERLEDFKSRWKSSVDVNSKSIPVTLFGLWAYDTVWALAMAAERRQKVTNKNRDFLNEILATNFSGLSGNFSLVKRQLEPSQLEIFNLIGHTERIIGYWSPETESFQDKSKVKEKLKPPIWPGDTTEQPTKYRIGVPKKKGFLEFMKVERRSPDGVETVSGFAIDVFREVVKVLPFPFPYEFKPFEKKNGDAAGTYDDLLKQIYQQKFDAVIGDVTIIAERTKYVDFTLPYAESEVCMVVPMKHDERGNMWIFLKPLSLGLWLTTGAAFVITGFIVWFLEHRTNTEFRGSPEQQLGSMFWFSFSTLVFAQKEKIVSNWSRFVLIIWVFVVLIITQSYTASLASMLTVQRLQPAFLDIKEIKRNNYSVGYQKDTFVRGFLVQQLGFNESNLRAYETPEEFHHAVLNGSSNGGVAAIFDEIPYMNIFLKKYGSRYKMVGPTYKTDGFGFAFPKKSPLVSYFSKAILNVTEDSDKFEGINNKYFSSRFTCDKDQSGSITLDSPSLTMSSFAGPFVITGVTSLFSLACHVFCFLYSQWPRFRSICSQERSFWWALTEMAKHFHRKDSSLYPPNRTDSGIHPATDEASFTDSDVDTDANGSDINPSRTMSLKVEAVNEEHSPACLPPSS